MTRFSIVTVCLNNLAGLTSTFESMGLQTCSDFEWVVVDGGSDDGTAEWLRGQHGVDWTSEPDRGIYHAMNKGLSRANGDYVIFMNAGDRLATRDVLEEVLKIVDSSNEPIDLIYGDSIDVLDSGEEFYRRARSHRMLWLGMFTQHQAMIFRRDKVGHARYHEDLALSGDYAFVAEFLSGRGGEPNVARVDWAICRFLLGGLTSLARPVALREDWFVRRRLLGMSPLWVSILYVGHWAHHLTRRYAPSLFRAIRYGRNP